MSGRSILRVVKKTMLVLVLAVLGAGCRKKPPLPNSDVTVAPPPAEAPAEQPTLVDVPTLPPPPPPLPATGHVPTSEEIRAKLQPIFPAIAVCVGKAGSIQAQERYLILRFGISSTTGSSLNAELTGHEEARGCVDEALKPLHFEPWNGPPSIITLPLTHAGEPVLESAFGDAGVK